MSHRTPGALSRRTVLSGIGVAAAGIALGRGARAQEATPVSPEADAWAYIDVLGNVVTLPQRPQRIAAHIQTAASLWDFGIHCQWIFGLSEATAAQDDLVAWGNIEPELVENISRPNGNLDLVKLAMAVPDLIVSWIWDKQNPAIATTGVPENALGRARSVAPILLLNQGDSSEIELARVEALAMALGADRQLPALERDRQELEHTIAAVREIALAKPDLTLLFASFGEPDTYYVASPNYVAELGYARSLGLNLANDGSPTATSYWETLSTEFTLQYPSDVIYLDGYGEWDTLEEVQARPTTSRHPAIAAGQVGYWHRDLPINYQGLTAFLEDLLFPLRTAKKVT